MPPRLPMSTAELVAFVQAHATRPLDEETAWWLIERLGRPRGHLVTVDGRGGPQLVGVLFAEMDNRDQAAELMIAAYRHDEKGPDAVDRALSWAEPLATAAGANHLEVALPATLGPLEARLVRRGYQLAYRNLTMALDPIGTRGTAALAPAAGLRWIDLDEAHAAAAHECYAGAFAGISGGQVPDLETFRSTLATARHRPRLLLERERVVAFARVALLPGQENVGEVRSIARHPAARGRGLGRAALDEALRQLKRLGATRACLEVASDNGPAVQLYEQSGFTTRASAAVLRRALGR